MKTVTVNGTGFDNIKVCELPVPQPTDNQILFRVDAATVCTSILKLIAQGKEHNFLHGWDPAKYPIIIGDEGALTVVKIGNNLKRKYFVGEKVAIQPAVDCSPINHTSRYLQPGKMNKTAIGYTLGGSFSQYLLIQEEVIRSNCLVKLPSKNLGYFEISLSEPLSCVVSSQDHHVHLIKDKNGERQPIKGLLKNGVTVIMGAGAMGRLHIELAKTYKPRIIIVFDVLESRLKLIKNRYQTKSRKSEVKVICLNPTNKDIPKLILHHTGQHYADDIIDATGIQEVQQDAVNDLTGLGSVFNSFGGLAVGKNMVNVDMRKIHYNESIITGSSGGNSWDTKKTLELINNGVFNLGEQVKMIGSLKHARLFLEMIRDKKIDGKAVIYPHAEIDEPIVVDSWSKDKEIKHLREYCHSREGGNPAV